jgi:hypothetical protein
MVVGGIGVGALRKLNAPGIVEAADRTDDDG